MEERKDSWQPKTKAEIIRIKANAVDPDGSLSKWLREYLCEDPDCITYPTDILMALRSDKSLRDEGDALEEPEKPLEGEDESLAETNECLRLVPQPMAEKGEPLEPTDEPPKTNDETLHESDETLDEDGKPFKQSDEAVKEDHKALDEKYERIKKISTCDLVDLAVSLYIERDYIDYDRPCRTTAAHLISFLLSDMGGFFH